jgi:Domain of unknown function (DUF4158)
MHPHRRRTLFPTEKSELMRLYTFSEQDPSVIKQRRGDANRLAMVARQLGIDEKVWAQYAEREETRREHFSELRAFLV